MAVDRPAPLDRVDRSLMTDPVTVLEPRPPILLPADAGLGQAVQAMMARGIGAVFVTGPNRCLVGILTERDFLTKIVGEPGYETLPVGQFMTRHPETVKPNDTLAFALGKMAGGGYRHLPVVDGGVPIGMVSVRDVLRYVVRLCADA
jgi:CBS domain-containing protein